MDCGPIGFRRGTCLVRSSEHRGLASRLTLWCLLGRTPGDNGQAFPETQYEPDSAFILDVVPQMSTIMVRGPSPRTALATSPSESTSSISGAPGQEDPYLAQTTAEGGPSRNGIPQNLGLPAADTLRERRSAQHALDWPPEFSLESRKGYSNQLVGLSGESDPFLLRHYRYDATDTYRMLRLDFRKVSDDTKAPGLASNSSRDNPDPSTAHNSIHFMMCDEIIWKDEVKATERLLAGSEGTEAADMALLNEIVTPDLGVRLLKL